MEISISEQNQKRIKQKVESGKYESIDDLLEKAFSALDARERAIAEEFADIEAKLAVADEQIENGELIPAKDVFDELRERNASAARQKQ